MSPRPLGRVRGVWPSAPQLVARWCGAPRAKNSQRTLALILAHAVLVKLAWVGKSPAERDRFLRLSQLLSCLINPYGAARLGYARKIEIDLDAERIA